jgi:predicted metal-binding membrane protein
VSATAQPAPAELHDRPGGRPARAGPALVRRRRFAGLPPPVLAAIALAWALALAAQLTGAAALLHHDALIEDGPAPLLAGLLFLLAWQVMIAAMMLPTSLPVIRMFAVASARAPHGSRATSAFLGGYALVWSGFGALAFGLDVGLHAAIDATPWLQRHEWAIAGSVLALAGAFQFTPLKDACLDKCRHPAQFMLRYYERGTAGGLRVGLRHGLFCLGCCWALMLVMFAVGAASLIVMGLLAAVMIHEKTRPAGARAVPLTGIALLALAAWILAYSAWSASVPA